MPQTKRVRYKKDFGIKDEDVEVYVNNPDLDVRFSAIAEILASKEAIKTASNYITTDFIGLRKANLDIGCPSAENFAELINLVVENKISSRVAKDILAMIFIKDESPLKIATQKNLLQSDDENTLKKIAQKIIDANPKIVADYKGGKEQALMSLVGQTMKETKGSANPSITKQILIDLLARP